MKLTTWIMLIIALTSTTIYGQSQAFAAVKNSEAVLLASERVELFNINTATVSTLGSLPGLGPKKAQAIVEYRERNGNFTSVEELINVKGIGEKMMAKLTALITV